MSSVRKLMVTQFWRWTLIGVNGWKIKGKKLQDILFVISTSVQFTRSMMSSMEYKLSWIDRAGCRILLQFQYYSQSTNRVATAAFWCTFHHDGKISPAGEVEGGGAFPSPFTIFTITYKVAMYAPAERADTLPLFHLYPICTLWYTTVQRKTFVQNTPCYWRNSHGWLLLFWNLFAGNNMKMLWKITKAHSTLSWGK
jgi:hypothetical protein